MFKSLLQYIMTSKWKTVRRHSKMMWRGEVFDSQAVFAVFTINTGLLIQGGQKVGLQLTLRHLTFIRHLFAYIIFAY